MLNNKFTHTFIANVVEKVRHQTSSFCSPEQFAQLLQHAEDAAPAAVEFVVISRCLRDVIPRRRTGKSQPEQVSASPKVSHQVVAEASALKPTFFDSQAWPTLTLLPFTQSQKLQAAYVGERIDLAEIILICWAVIRYPAPKPTATLLALIEMCWHRWDELDALDELEREKRRDQCARGGIKRHAKHAALKEQAIPLLASAAPPAGWLSKSHAGDVVAALVVQIAKESGYTGSLESGRWSRTIQQLIREDLRAKDAFEIKRSVRRCHRATGTRVQQSCRARRKDGEGRDEPGAEACT